MTLGAAPWRGSHVPTLVHWEGSGEWVWLCRACGMTDCPYAAAAFIDMMLPGLGSKGPRGGSAEDRIKLALEQADYGAVHGRDAQDTLDAVLTALAGKG